MKNIVTLLFCLLVNLSFSQEEKYSKGLEAFDTKEFSKALKLMRPYADLGDPTAQFITGFCYLNNDLPIKNDSIAEYYLTKSAEQKFGRAMGLLSILYFEKSANKSKFKIDALVWAEIAAVYDSIQKGTTTRYLIKAYLTEDELKEVEQILIEKKSEFKKISLEEFHSSTPFDNKNNSDKAKIPENYLGLPFDPYSNWVSRWKYEQFECDTLYYTQSIDSSIINATTLKIQSSEKFELWPLYRGKMTEGLKLKPEEKELILNELSILKEHKWKENLFPFSKCLDSNDEIFSTFERTENLETEKEINMCAIIYTFSKPIFFRDKTLVLFLDQKRYRTNYTQLSFSFYSFENNKWNRLAVAYKYYESRKK